MLSYYFSDYRATKRWAAEREQRQLRKIAASWERMKRDFARARAHA